MKSKMHSRFVCENCGKDIDEKSTKCPHCGTLLQGIKCSACGFVGPRSAFLGGWCPKCNAHVIYNVSIDEIAEFAKSMRTRESKAKRPDLYGDSQENIRRNMKQMKEKHELHGLILALKFPDNYQVRQEAASALGELGVPYAVDALTVALKDSEWKVRLAAVISLGQLGAEESLKFALKDANEAVRSEADSILKKRADDHDLAMQAVREIMKRRGIDLPSK